MFSKDVKITHVSYIFLAMYLGRSPGVCTLIAMVGESMVGGLQSLGGHI